MKTLILGYGFKRETTIIKNYGKQLNNLKYEISKKFNITLSQAYKVIKTLNRNNKVIFNNGKVSFMLKINSIANKVNKSFKTALSSKVEGENKMKVLNAINQIILTVDDEEIHIDKETRKILFVRIGNRNYKSNRYINNYYYISIVNDYFKNNGGDTKCQ